MTARSAAALASVSLPPRQLPQLRAAARAARPCFSGYHGAPWRGREPVAPLPVAPLGAAAVAAATGRNRLAVCPASSGGSANGAACWDASPEDIEKEQPDQTTFEQRKSAEAVTYAAALVAATLMCALLLWHMLVSGNLAAVVFAVSAWSLPAVPWGPWATAKIVAFAFLGASIIADMLVATVVIACRLTGNTPDKKVYIPCVPILHGLIGLALLWNSLANYSPFSHGLFAAPVKPFSAWLPAPIAVIAALVAARAALAIFKHRSFRKSDQNR
ncbi:hypothetical protein COHA_004636 [Chlorella ohadii]|uniref:Uncharacterized protein n=1 Tax=Chlorella ohadii TaxID=2649997 RepID=A0AAD5DT37_9CHLO|nr:hypothetical protein COHA_004636 [Chlorella ohadii]